MEEIDIVVAYKKTLTYFWGKRRILLLFLFLGILLGVGTDYKYGAYQQANFVLRSYSPDVSSTMKLIKSVDYKIAKQDEEGLRKEMPTLNFQIDDILSVKLNLPGEFTFKKPYTDYQGTIKFKDESSAEKMLKEMVLALNEDANIKSEFERTQIRDKKIITQITREIELIEEIQKLHKTQIEKGKEGVTTNGSIYKEKVELYKQIEDYKEFVGLAVPFQLIDGEQLYFKKVYSSYFLYIVSISVFVLLFVLYGFFIFSRQLLRE